MVCSGELSYFDVTEAVRGQNTTVPAPFIIYKEAHSLVLAKEFRQTMDTMRGEVGCLKNRIGYVVVNPCSMKQYTG